MTISALFSKDLQAIQLDPANRGALCKYLDDKIKMSEHWFEKMNESIESLDQRMIEVSDRMLKLIAHPKKSILDHLWEISPSIFQKPEMPSSADEVKNRLQYLRILDGRYLRIYYSAIFGLLSALASFPNLKENLKQSKIGESWVKNATEEQSDIYLIAIEKDSKQNIETEHRADFYLMSWKDSLPDFEKYTFPLASFSTNEVEDPLFFHQENSAIFIPEQEKIAGFLKNSFLLSDQPFGRAVEEVVASEPLIAMNDNGDAFQNEI